MTEIDSGRFALSLEEIDPFTREPMRIDLHSDKAIFRPPHKLGQVEWDFFEAQ